MNRPHLAVLVCSLTLALGALACAPEGAEEPAATVPPAAATETAPAEPAAAEPAPAATGALLDPNAAPHEALLAVAQVDAATADALIAGRPYADMLAVDAVLAKTLDEAQREEVYRALFKPLDLNSASGEEILLIPGVGARMRHEFEEYRPYRGIAEFRREIGKYVDDAEVARLAQYVTVP